jgi:hypothetical protein
MKAKPRSETASENNCLSVGSPMPCRLSSAAKAGFGVKRKWPEPLPERNQPSQSMAPASRLIWKRALAPAADIACSRERPWSCEASMPKESFQFQPSELPLEPFSLR